MPEAPDMHKILFANLIMMLSHSAMQQLGKLVNPVTNKAEVSLEGARMTIDMLEMIKAKTKGNLDDEENRMLREILSNLQMNYVETSQNPPEKEKKEDSTEEDKAEEKKKS
jgi:hypothetical protein